MSQEIRKKIRKDIEAWNIRFPLDYWWRKKYNIPFNSPKHKEQSVIDTIMEYEEDLMYKEIINTPIKEKDEEKDYIPNSGHIWNPMKEVAQEISDDEFDNIDFNKI